MHTRPTIEPVFCIWGFVPGCSMKIRSPYEHLTPRCSFAKYKPPIEAFPHIPEAIAAHHGDLKIIIINHKSFVQKRHTYSKLSLF